MKYLAITAALLMPLALRGILAQGVDRVLVLCNPAMPAYKEALEGIRETLGREPEVLSTETGGAAALEAMAQRGAGRVYIALGRDALRSAARAKADIPIVAAMILRDDVVAESKPLAGEVYLDVPPRLLLQEVRRLFPRRSRLGVLASGNIDRAALLARGRELGFSVQIAEVNGAADLVKKFLEFKGRADLVLALPDSALYNSATVKPLVLASLEHRLPIIGFSSAFVQAGAAAGVFADLRDAGRQAAERAIRYDPRSAQHALDEPRKLTVAVNQKVLRLLGLEYQHADSVVVYR